MKLDSVLLVLLFFNAQCFSLLGPSFFIFPLHDLRSAASNFSYAWLTTSATIFAFPIFLTELFFKHISSALNFLIVFSPSRMMPCFYSFSIFTFCRRSRFLIFSVGFSKRPYHFCRKYTGWSWILLHLLALLTQ